MTDSRLEKQILFLLEIDRLKNILRRNPITIGERYEDTAEHSWHIAIMAMLLEEYSDEPVDICRVIKMALIHDLVEIDAGDTYAYDSTGALDKADREHQAALRIFGMLPTDQAAELHELWNEFEARQTPEARFANAVDRLMPLLHNFYSSGKSWQDHKVQSHQVHERMRPIGDSSQTLLGFAQKLIQEAVEKGYLGS